MVTRLIMVIILPHTQVSNRYVVHLKLIQYCLSITPQLKKTQLGKKKMSIHI